jgi:hypothetical protein
LNIHHWTFNIGHFFKRWIINENGHIIPVCAGRGLFVIPADLSTVASAKVEAGIQTVGWALAHQLKAVASYQLWF